MKYILGVDAAWSAANPSGVALIQYGKHGRPELIRAGRSYDEFISGEINWDEKARGSIPDFVHIFNCCPSVDIVALDMPIAPFEITGRREVDQALSKAYGRFKAATHSPVKGRPGVLAKQIFDQLTNLGLTWAIDYSNQPAFFEVYPHASIIELFDLKERLPYKVSKKSKYWPDLTSDEGMRRLLENLTFLKKGLNSLIDGIEGILPELKRDKKYTMSYLKGYEDLLDALVCCYTGYCYLKGRIKPFGDHEGVAWVPDKEK